MMQGLGDAASTQEHSSKQISGRNGGVLLRKAGAKWQEQLSS
jgi:hypothetical protein